MAVVIEAFEVILRVGAIQDRFPGGIAAFHRDSPNSTMCDDGRIVRVSFMDSLDRAAFVDSLARHGLRPEEGHLACLDANSVGQAARGWLSTGTYGGVFAAWLSDSEPEPLVVPIQWRPGAAPRYLSSKEVAEHLELVGREGNVDVCIDRRTGKRLYSVRTSSRVELDEATASRLESLRREGSDLLTPFIGLSDRSGRSTKGWLARRRFRKGVEKLEMLLASLPDHWQSNWMLGMALRSDGQHERSREHLRRAYLAQPGQPDVAREYGCQCLILGQAEEGLRVAEANAKQHPEDAGLQSNLGLALLIAGQVDRAIEVTRASFERDQSDPVSAALLLLAEDVKAGKKPHPTRLPWP